MTFYVFFEDRVILESETTPDARDLPMASYVFGTTWDNPWCKVMFNQTYQRGIMINADEDVVPKRYRAMALLLS